MLVCKHKQKIEEDKKCRQIAGNFDCQRGCSSTMQGTSPDGAHPGLHLKPLDAAILQVPVPYRSDSRHG